MDRIETIKTHFEAEAEEFDNTILKLIPHYTESEMIVIDI